MRTWINAFCACLLLLSGLCQATETYVTYYQNDHLGSPAAATDDQGKLLWRAHYRPYGEREPHRDSAAFGTLGYTGHAQNERNGLVYAGARYYDPLVGRFLSVDPVGPKQAGPGSFNRYAYALNNPYRYIDPDGRAAFALLLLAPEIEGALVYGGAAILGTVGGAYLAEEVIQPGIDGANSGEPKSEPKGHRFPDRELPRDEHGRPMADPEAEGAHTQLGQKEGRRGKYDQAREFDATGKPVKDIDFTDHGRPQDHTNPHEHPYLPNPTGGTPQHGPARPLRN